jgi:Cu/Ag efflux pump CusA
MISHINDLRKKGYGLKDSVIKGAHDRFRPVLMTATVAVIGYSRHLWQQESVQMYNDLWLQ